MTETLQQVQTIPAQPFSSAENFEHIQRVAKVFSESELVPQSYKGKVGNTVIALEMANRLGVSPIAVMQNLHVIQGKPSWSSTFVIAAINASKKFTKLKFLLTGEGMDRGCVAYAKEIGGDGETVEGPRVTMKMAKDEGWLDKSGSKWKTMPDLMLSYRSAAFFGRLHVPEIMMGLQTHEEVIDITAQATTVQEARKDEESNRIILMIQDCKTMDDLQQLQPYVKGEKVEQAFNDKLTALA